MPNFLANMSVNSGSLYLRSKDTLPSTVLLGQLHRSQDFLWFRTALVRVKDAFLILFIVQSIQDQVSRVVLLRGKLLEGVRVAVLHRFHEELDGPVWCAIKGNLSAHHMQAD